MEELAAAFALEALPTGERTAYAEHLALCGVCRQVADQFQMVAGLLPEALVDEQGSPELKRRILAQAREEEVRRQARQIPSPRRAEGRAAWSCPWLGPLAPVRVGVIAVLILLAALAGWNIYLQINLINQRDLLAEQGQLLSALAAGARVAQLPGTQAAPQASATLVQVPKAGRAFLLVRNLPQLHPDREYQLWRIAGGVPVSMGTFTLRGGTEQLLNLGADLSSAEAIGISIEPRGGSLAPTGPIVVLGPP